MTYFTELWKTQISAYIMINTKRHDWLFRGFLQMAPHGHESGKISPTVNSQNQPYMQWNIHAMDARHSLLHVSALLGCHLQGVFLWLM